MANIKTLKPFQKGHDPRRNTKGRPKGNVSSFQKILDRELAREVDIGNGRKATVETIIMMRLISDAHKGKLSAIKLLFNYSYGKPVNYCPKCDNVVDTSFKKKFSESNRKKQLEAIEKEVDDWMNEWEELAKK